MLSQEVDFGTAFAEGGVCREMGDEMRHRGAVEV